MHVCTPELAMQVQGWLDTAQSGVAHHQGCICWAPSGACLRLESLEKTFLSGNRTPCSDIDIAIAALFLSPFEQHSIVCIAEQGSNFESAVQNECWDSSEEAL